MESGIKLKCKKKFGQFLISEKPYCIVNDVEAKQLEWGKEIFIPLQPNRPYRITVQFPYMDKMCGIVSFSIQLNSGEIQVYEYNTPFLVTSAGTIKRKS